ncbi:winged helix-turn-helix domain-containing protein [Streptomyces sp. NPDC047000]|uniref:winged helix-turn-helix domain-containing protein n=1 Tax=Streptomyces sp. NPDC047000 TaxID=3155474 RepID=UPI0033EEF008
MTLAWSSARGRESRRSYRHLRAADAVGFGKQIADHVATDIASGELTGRVPSELELRREYSAGASTVQRSLAVLRERGLIYTVPGRGSFVRHPDDDAGASATGGA